MCLVSKDGKKKASCDIVCYKVVCHGKFSGHWWAPKTLVSIPNDVISGNRVYWAYGEPNVVFCSNLMYRVGCGYIHVYKELADICLRTFHCNSNLRYSEKQVYECIIKKGTEYWESFDGSELCARKIRFVRRIK